MSAHVDLHMCCMLTCLAYMNIGTCLSRPRLLFFFFRETLCSDALGKNVEKHGKNQAVDSNTTKLLHFE